MDTYRIRTVHFLKRRIASLALVAVLVLLGYFGAFRSGQVDAFREAFADLIAGKIGPQAIILIAVVVAAVIALFVIQALTSVTTTVEVGDSELAISASGRSKRIAYTDIMRMEVAGRGAKSNDPAMVIFGASPIPLYRFETNGTPGRSFSDGRLAFDRIVNRVRNSAAFDSHIVGPEQSPAKTVYSRRPATLGQIINQLAK
ncbi:MAG: hypothetical protein LBR58_03140 [Propionibacteriaceae bacterium]|jgi:hypothetical protein|nr:hypothetical protein [Propionibacteriaceae bacterium]